MSRVLALAVFFLYLTSSHELLGSDKNSGDNSKPANRLDFTSVFFDSLDTDKLTGIFGYTRNLSPKSNLSLRVAYLDSQFGLSGGSGIGDTTATWSYLPNLEITVGPWVPRIVGSGISVTLPTGDEKQGRGLGSTIITPFVGTVVPITDTLSFTPTLAYAYSVDAIITGKNVRIGLLDIGLTMVRKSGWWASLYIGYVNDFVANNTSFGTRLSAGKAFSSGWGLSAHYIDLENFIPGVVPIDKSRFNQLYELTVSYRF